VTFFSRKKTTEVEKYDIRSFRCIQQWYFDMEQLSQRSAIAREKEPIEFHGTINSKVINKIYLKWVFLASIATHNVGLQLGCKNEFYSVKKIAIFIITLGLLIHISRCVVRSTATLLRTE